MYLAAVFFLHIGEGTMSDTCSLAKPVHKVEFQLFQLTIHKGRGADSLALQPHLVGSAFTLPDDARC